MQGPSSFGGPQSPSVHSSSYLPKLEANFMRDFTCCGLILPNLHDLLQHYEEAHTSTSPNAARGNNFSQFGPMGIQGSNRMGGTRTNSSTPGPSTAQASPTRPGRTTPGGGLPLMAAVQRNEQLNNSAMGNLPEDMDAVADMEMDDAVGTMELDDSQRMHQTRHMFGQQQRPQLHMETSGLSQALRTSQPTTPAAASFGFQHNPTVSSVNTPTLTTQQQQHLPQQQQSMDVDAMDEDIPGMPMGGGGNNDLGDGNFGTNGNGDSNFCIDDPGKSLFSPNGAFPTGNRSFQQQLAQLGLTQAHLSDPQANKVLIQRLQTMMMSEEHKPYKCPVIGCEKAYKNQNGLK